MSATRTGLRNGTKRRTAAVLVLLASAVPATEGCSPMFPFQPDQPESAPISDDESRAQVVDAAVEIAKAANLDVTYANYQWEWCNDQGEPPYRSRVDIAFTVPPGTTSADLSKKVASTAAAQPGWAAGAPPGIHSAGDVVHKGNVWAVIGPGNYPERGGIQIFGECRNMNDHRDTGGVEITEEVRGG